MLFERDYTSTIWIVGALTIANVWLAIGSTLGWLLWMIFAGVVMLVDVIRVNNQIKLIRTRMMIIDRMQSEAQKMANQPTKKVMKRKKRR